MPPNAAAVDDTFKMSHKIISSLFKALVPGREAKAKLTKPKLHDISPFWLHLIYFTSASLIGFFLLAALPMKPNTAPSRFDLLFMSISASTVSSMVALSLESFSPSQLALLIALMFLGGEVFTSLLHLSITHHKNHPSRKQPHTIEDEERPSSSSSELTDSTESESIQRSSSKLLLCVVSAYLLLTHLAGYFLIKIYFALYPSSRAVLDRKGIQEDMFVVFTVVSSFSNCGFLPTNENMMVFKNCSGILITVGALILLGNTMYPVGLRLTLSGLNAVFRKRELEFLLKDDRRKLLGYEGHLMSGETDMVMLGVTVSGFIALQTVLFICFEWKSEGLRGMNSYQKVVGSLFMSVNSRHSGESIVDLSAVAPAVLVLFVVMMYLPPYTTFLPTNWRGSGEGENKKRKSSKGLILENLTFSQLSYLAIFVIVICITERARIHKDPLNFNVLNIVVEVVSAYGNVGYSTGYSCKRQLVQDEGCADTGIGFSGKWSKAGKLTLMLVMMFGRLKKFINNGGRAWMLR